MKKKINNQRRTNKNESIYKQLLLKALKTGIKTPNRTGIDTLTLTNQTITFDMSDVPLMTGKKMFWKHAINELLLFIKGATNIEDFHKYNIKYWDQFADENGELGPIYGSQWINFNGHNQLTSVIKSMSDNPQGRRHIISAWNPAELHKMALPPCPVSIQFNIVNDTIDALVFQRSADGFLGVPFDIFQYYLLTRLINESLDGKQYKLGKLTFTYGNFHIYTNHIDVVNKYLDSKVFAAPTMETLKTTDDININKVLNYKHGPYLPAKIN